MIKKWLWFVSLTTGMVFAQDNQLSPQSEISFLTVGQGGNLVDAFGHSAIWVSDRDNRINKVFNYGFYDFEEDNFILKFAQGKLKYSLEITDYNVFVNYYRIKNRWVKAQVLSLSLPQKQALYDFLMLNFQPHNRKYLYEPFSENCATKLPYVLEKILGQKTIVYHLPQNFVSQSFRGLMHDYIPRNSWGCFGIDIALGAVMDRIATVKEHMYLPDYVYEFFKDATVEGQKIIAHEYTILDSTRPARMQTNFLWSPLMIFGILMGIILWVTYRDKKRNKRSRGLDFFIFLITGLVGIAILLLWFATDHSITKNNYDLLWAFPLNLLLAWNLLKKSPSKWSLPFIKLLLLLLCLLTLHWAMGIQVFAVGLIPLFLALGIRYLYLIRYLSK